ncbi:unnamed protein product [Arabidopsis thaliana]|uniref:Transmembrane protein n=1 Tax=Arabidopsis thaliana TaxID=3702 RepID=A0A5S9XPZ5_ARATH|nr:unnamed protein product [Arabidopsis thaliana]
MLCVCGYLNGVSLMKLCHEGNNLGFVNGIASVTLSIFTHYCEAYHFKILGIFLCWAVILVKNILFTSYCRRCGGGGGGAGGGGAEVVVVALEVVVVTLVVVVAALVVVVMVVAEMELDTEA